MMFVKKSSRLPPTRQINSPHLLYNLELYLHVFKYHLHWHFSISVSGILYCLPTERDDLIFFASSYPTPPEKLNSSFG